MPFSIKCQVCDFGFKVGDEHAGRRGKCPKCGELFQVPPAATPVVHVGTTAVTESASQVIRKAKLLSDPAPSPATPRASKPKVELSESAMLRRAKLLDDSQPSEVHSESIDVIPAIDKGSNVAKRAVPPPLPPADDAFPGIQINTSPKPADKSGLHKAKKSDSKSSLGKSSSSSKSSLGKVSIPSPDSSSRSSAGPQPLVTIGDNDDRLHRYSSRRKGPRVPLWAWFVIGGVGLFSGLGAVAYNALNPPAEQTVAQAPPKRRANEPKLNTAPLVAPTNEASAPPVKKPTAGSPLEDVVEYVEHGIVKIDTYDGWDRNGIGSGFVIDKSGLIATNYHVVADCVKADVLFNNGVRFGVEGYVAVKPECDLAILKLNGVPENIQTLDLSIDSPRNASAVYAIGHPHDYKFTVTNGIVSALPRTTELPESSQEFLKESMTDKSNNFWIQHNAQIAPGNSGGPLINARGDVIGINTWVDESIKSGFAIQARHLDQMRNNLLPQVAPLTQYRRPPERVVVRQQGIKLSSEQFQQLFSAAAAKDWQPKTEKDYESLCELAFLVTYANSLKRRLAERPGGVPKEFEPIASQADEVAQSLEKISWQSDTHIPAVNTYAATNVFHRDEGVFLFGKVKKTFADKEGRKGMVMNLTGTKEEVFVPLLEDADEPAADTQFLVLGVARGSMFMGENPLDQKEVPLVLSYTVLKVAP